MVNTDDLMNPDYIDELCDLLEQMESIRDKITKTAYPNSFVKLEKKWYQVIADTIVAVINKIGDVAMFLIFKLAELLKSVDGINGLFSKVNSFG